MMRPSGPKPKKAHSSFPLFAHASGTWAKTIDGKHKHFGPWHDPEGALARFKEFDAARRGGRAVREGHDAITLKGLFNRFATHQHNRMKAGDISVKTFADAKDQCEAFVVSVGADLRPMDLAPDHFGNYRKELAERMGYHALKRTIIIIKGMFRWALRDDLIDRLPRYGSQFDSPTKASGRREQKERQFSPDEIRRMIETAKGPSLCFVLLGINCAFGNTDIGSLPMAAVDLDAGVIDYRRTKTGIARRCPLWPETVAALREYVSVRPAPSDPKWKDLFFITRWGNPFVNSVRQEKDGMVEGAVTSDGVSLLFGKLMGKLGLWKPAEKGKHFVSDGRNFYTLRRTHRTWAQETGNERAAGRIMGHDVHGDVPGMYVQSIHDDQLRSITDHIHAKLFTSKTDRPPRKSAPRAGGGKRRGG